MAKKKVKKVKVVKGVEEPTFTLEYTGAAKRAFLGHIWEDKEGSNSFEIPMSKRNAISEGMIALGFKVKE